jgi:hypothetical protein
MLPALCAMLPPRRVEPVGPATAWRVFLSDPAARAAAGEAGGNDAPVEPAGLLPPAGWMLPGFDAGRWARRAGEVFGGYGYGESPRHALLCMRTAFRVDNPRRAGAAQLTVEYRGGAVAYLNGREIARGHMPEGQIGVQTAARPYSVEAYLAPDGHGFLPRAERPAREHADRYERRVRKLAVKLPPGALVRGDNVLAIELHRAADPDFIETDRYGSFDAAEWNPLGFYGARLTCRARRGAFEAAAGDGDVLAHNADVLEPVADGPEPSAWQAEPLRPLTLVAPRNGACSAQLVLSCRSGLTGVAVEVGPLVCAGGERIAPEAVRVRYAVREAGPYCDTLAERPAEGARAAPVWVIAEIPAGQAPGRYEGRIALRAGSRGFEAPVAIEVCAWTLPAPRDYVTHVSLLHSPDTLAVKYGVEPYGQRHLALIAKSLELMGTVGNDVLFVPVVRYTHLGNDTGMIRWVRAGERPEADFTAFDAFLDLYEKHVGPPKVLCLDVWNLRIRDGAAPAVTARDPRSGTMSEMAAPMYGGPGAEAFWKPVMDGVRERVLRRGWDERCIMVGVASDRWPRRETVEFFRAIAPYARWAVFTHGRWRGRRESRDDGRMSLAEGMEIGYHEDPWGYGGTRLVGDIRYRPWTERYVKAGAMRECVSDWSPPVRFRNLSDMSVNKLNQGFGRVGLDYGRVDGRPLIGRHERWETLYRDNPRAIAVAGPDGALPTVRYQMLREGVQEAEARIVIAGALAREDAEETLGADLAKRCRDLLDQRRAARAAARDLPEAQVSCDWLGLTAGLYAAAGEVAAAKSRAKPRESE